MKITRAKNSGIPGRKAKDIDVTSANVAPTTLVATSAGALMDINLLENYDRFNVAQTSAVTDVLRIPADTMAIGAKFELYVLSIIELRGVDGSLVELNDVGDDDYEIALAVGDLVTVNKVSATNIIVTSLTKKGAAATLVPDA